jgi:hypothetical protein
MAESYITRKGGGGGKLYNAYINVGGEVYEEFKYIGGTPSNHRFGYWIKNDKITGTSYFANNPITTTVNATIESNNISFLKITRMPIAQNNNLVAVATNGAKFVLTNSVNNNGTHYDWNWWYLNNSASSSSYYTNKGIFDTTNRVLEIAYNSLAINTTGNLLSASGSGSAGQFVGNGFWFLPNYNSGNTYNSFVTTIDTSTFTAVNTFRIPFTNSSIYIQGLYYINGSYYTEGWLTYDYAQYHIWKLTSSNLTNKALQSSIYGVSSKTYIDNQNFIWKAHYPSSGGRSIFKINSVTLENAASYYQGTSPYPQTPVTDNSTYMYFCTTSGSYPYFRKAWISNGTAVYDWGSNMGYSDQLMISNGYVYGLQQNTLWTLNIASNSVSGSSLGGTLSSYDGGFFSGDYLYLVTTNGIEKRITKYSLPGPSLVGSIDTNATFGIFNFRLINHSVGNNIFGFDWVETNTAKQRAFKINWDTSTLTYRYQMIYKGDE